MAVNWLYCRGGTAETFIMGLAGLLKAGWLNLVTSSRMDRMGLLAMGRTAKSSNG